MEKRDDLVASLVARAREAARPREDTVAAVRIVLGDALTLALASRKHASGRPALRFSATAPVGPATVVGQERGVATEAAVIVNSSLVHALLLDDAHAPTMVHPGAVVIPVVLATAEEAGAGIAAVLGGIAAGYEVFAAAAAPVAAVSASLGFRNTALFGPLAAAAAGATVLGLDDDRFAAALLIASGSAGGTLQAFRANSPEWRFQPGLAGQIGLTAVRLAQSLPDDSLPFPAGALESEHGLYATFARTEPPARSDSESLAVFEVSHKVHATCGANQVPVAALAAIVRSGVGRDDIVGIDVQLSPASFAYPGCEDYGPFREGGTFLSRPFALAATVITGGAALDDAGARRALADPGLDALARRVRSHVVPAEQLRSAQDAVVEVTLADGTVRRVAGGDLDPRDLKPDWPMIAARLVALDPVAGARLVELLARLPEGDLTDLTGALRSVRSLQEDS